MSAEEAFFIARIAKRKLLNEASGNDPNLRQLLSHANLLDNLIYRMCIPPTSNPSPVALGNQASRLAKSTEQGRMNSDWAPHAVQGIDDEPQLQEDTSESITDDSDSSYGPDSDGSDSDQDPVSDEDEYDGLMSALMEHDLFISRDDHGRCLVRTKGSGTA